MTHADYSQTLQLLNAALHLVREAERRPSCRLSRDLRALALRLDVVRACFGQAHPRTERN